MADAASSRPLRPSVSAGRSSSQDQRALETLVLFVGGALVVTCLALGKQVFLPIAIAVLLSFVLAGPVNWMRTMGVPRVPSVILVTTFAVMMLALAGLVLVRQATQLANDLPTYQSVIVSKVDTLRAGLTQSPLVERALQTLRSLDRQTKAPVQEQQKGTAPSEPARAEPVPVEVHQPSPGPFVVLLKLAASIFEPLATSGLVIVFFVFILLQREDLRDRLIRLAGAQDLSRTTAAIDDAAQRLSRYLLTLTAMNAGFGKNCAGRRC
jgi:predicted PurR-regulated permease PerM